MEEDLMFNIEALDPRTPTAVVYGADNKPRCKIKLGQSIHLWHIDMVLAAYRLYWTADGKRDPNLNDRDGIEYVATTVNMTDVRKDMMNVSKRIIDAVCRNGRYDQPNLLRKINVGRYTLLRRELRKDIELYVSGGYEKPYYFTRRIGSTDVLEHYDNYDKALTALN